MFWTLLTFSSKIIFRVSKRCSEALEQYFWDFASRKLVDERFCSFFNDWYFWYQLVNLVLETCLIFSEILKLSKTYSCPEFLVLFDRSNNERYDFPIPDYFSEWFSRECCSWIFYKVNCGVNIGFLTHVFSKGCLKFWLVKKKS